MTAPIKGEKRESEEKEIRSRSCQTKTRGDDYDRGIEIWRGVFFVTEHLPRPLGATVSDLQVVQLCLERLDGAVSNFQVFVETITFCDEL